MAASGVTHVVAIQTSTAYRWDNRFVADTTREAPAQWTGVCTLDPLDATSPTQLRTFVRDCRIRGLRSITASAHSAGTRLGMTTTLRARGAGERSLDEQHHV